MVSLRDTVRKTAAIDEDRSGAEQVVEPSGTGGSEQSKPLTVVKNVAAVGFGIVGNVILLFTLLLCAMELTRTFLLWNAERKRHRMSIEERVRQSQKLMFKLIRASFNQRRKTLANGLSNAPQVHLSKEEIQECIAELGEPLTIRGEALTLEQFAALSNIIGNRQKK